jgi:hypothetical protein
LEADPWPSVRTIAEVLKIPAPMVHLHPTASLDMKSPHFKWVPRFLDALRVKQLAGAWQLLDVLQAQEGCHFRDLITGYETLIYFDMKPGTIWFPTDTELPARVKSTIASEKCMLIVFWDIHEIAHHCWLPKDSH